MSSGHGNCEVSSAASSPRKRALNAFKDSATTTPPQSAALHSAWIQRIIPSQTYNRKSHDDILCIRNDGFEGRAAALVHNMELADDEDDDEFEVTSSERKSLFIKSVDDQREKLASPFFTASEAEVTLWKAGSSAEKLSASLNCSKVVPLSEDHVVDDQISDQDAAELQSHVKIPETLGTSAWFTRITKKDAEAAGEERGKTKTMMHEEHTKTLRFFPPLKSGEQWPGTLKPSNLPPLRIPSTKDARQGDLQQHLPFLTPVTLPAKEKQALERKQTSTSSTWSLPSNFLEETRRGAKKSSNSSVNTSSSMSDTESLLGARLDLNVDDEADSASVKKTRQMEALTSTAVAGGAADNSFSRIVFNCSEKSNHPGQSLPIIPPRSKEQQENDSLDSAGAAAAASAKAAARSRQNLRPVQLQVRGSHQWLQRWCTPPGPSSDVKRLH